MTPKRSSKKSRTPSRTARQFDPPDVVRTTIPRRDGRATDKSDEVVYVFKPSVRLAIEVALATGRPLLVRGAPGWGKSSLAKAASAYLRWDYLSHVISSRTQARDLLWEVDLILRLNDAEAEKLESDWAPYIRPGVLWSAFNPGQAARQSARYAHGAATTTSRTPTPRSVVLLDEIDKADPDVPNNLLVPLGELKFDVPELDLTVQVAPENAPLIIITTNEERDLPAAFLRRCVELRLPAVEGDDGNGAQQRALLIDIGEQHLDGTLDAATVKRIAQAVLGDAGSSTAGTELPSPAELLDTLWAAAKIFDGKPTKADLAELAGLTLWKHGRRKPQQQ